MDGAYPRPALLVSACRCPRLAIVDLCCESVWRFFEKSIQRGGGRTDCNNGSFQDLPGAPCDSAILRAGRSSQGTSRQPTRPDPPGPGSGAREPVTRVRYEGRAAPPARLTWARRRRPQVPALRAQLLVACGGRSPDKGG